MGVRLQKWLADRSIAPSRREAERWIQQGRLKINKNIAVVGQSVALGDAVFLDGKRVKGRLAEQVEVLLYHKPVGEICSRVGEQTLDSVFQSLPKPKQGRLIMVGRLDVQTSGLLLFTQDGQLAEQLMHPRHALKRTYKIRVHGEVTESIQQKLCEGVYLSDGLARFDTLQLSHATSGRNAWLEVTLHQGRNRIIRRMMDAVNLPINRLLRIGFGPVILPKYMPPGSWQFLNEQQISQLRKAIKKRSDKAP